MFSTNRTAAVFLLLFLGFWFISCVYSYRAWNSESENEEENADSGDVVEEGISPLASKISKMNAEERMELYNKAFDKNKHQTVIQASSIIRGDPNSPTNATSDTEDDSSRSTTSSELLKEDPSIYLALEQARVVRRSTIASRSTKRGIEFASAEIKSNEDAKEKPNRRRSSLIHPRASMDMENVGGMLAKSNKNSNSGTANTIVRGNCVICFEDIEAGETVVWSENKACQHVYHKECMVAYLAHKKHTLKEIELDENPCPTCRRKFVTVCPTAKCSPAK